MWELSSKDIQYCLWRNIKLEKDLWIDGNILRNIKWKTKEIMLKSSVIEQLEIILKNSIIKQWDTKRNLWVRIKKTNSWVRIEKINLWVRIKKTNPWVRIKKRRHRYSID